MPNTLTGKIALVTGGSRGIGAAADPSPSTWAKILKEG
jgi:hypothetical protein